MTHVGRELRMRALNPNAVAVRLDVSSTAPHRQADDRRTLARLADESTGVTHGRSVAGTIAELESAGGDD